MAESLRVYPHGLYCPHCGEWVEVDAVADVTRRMRQQAINGKQLIDARLLKFAEELEQAMQAASGTRRQ